VNRVALSLAGAGAVACLGLGFLSLAPNRLLSGRAVALWDAAGPAPTAAIVVLLALLAASAFAAPSRVQAGLATALLLAAFAAAGAGARDLAGGASGLARVALGAGFWVLAGAAALAVVDGVQRAGGGLGAPLAAAAAVVAGLAAMAAAGWFDALSLMREYHTREAAFAAALGRHIVLVAGSVGPALLIGVPLGLAAARRPRLGGTIFPALNLLQTIPSLALFGLLIAPLTALGLGGIGLAPALIALTLYALLPVARSTAAGIAAIDPAVTDAARGMGMTARQILWRVEVPLAVPVLIAGLRIVTVQAIGLAVVAALIGAGGLGSFVFEGLGQNAADLVLLGALPAIGLALAADLALQGVAELAR